MGKRGTFIVL